MDSLDEELEVLEAQNVFILMDNEYRSSRNAKAEWFLKNLDKTVSIPRRLDMQDYVDNLDLISVIPNPACIPEEWDSDTSHLYTYHILPSTLVTFLSKKYRFVFCIDLSSSSACVNLHSHDVIHGTAFSSLRRCLEGMLRPFFIPGSEFLLQPKIYVTVIAYVPFMCMSCEQVLLQGWIPSEKSLESILSHLAVKFRNLENLMAKETMLMLDRKKNAKSRDVNPMRVLFDDEIVLEKRRSKNSFQTFDNKECAMAEMLRLGLLALTLLPENSSAHIVLLTDGVNASPDLGSLDPMLAQLRIQGVVCSIVHLLGGPFQPQQSVGLLPYTELLSFIAQATFGTYLTQTPVLEMDYQRNMNLYHQAFFAWSFQRASDSHTLETWDWEDMYSSYHGNDPKIPAYRSIENANFRNAQERLLRKPCLSRVSSAPHVLQIDLLNHMSSRLREGFAVKLVNVGGDKFTMSMVYYWKPFISFEYVIVATWPDYGESIMYEIYVQGPYDFLNDISAGRNFVLPSSSRKKNVMRYRVQLKTFTQTDNLLVHLHAFLGNPTLYTIPERYCHIVKVPVLRFPSPAPSTILATGRDARTANFVSFWERISTLEPAFWQRWLHIWRMGILLEHDRPLPTSRHMHHPNAAGIFDIASCRQAATALATCVEEWATFILTENSCYIKFLYSDAEKPPVSFCLLKIISKYPYVILRLGFLGGTPAAIRQREVSKLRERVLHLTFPLKPSEAQQTFGVPGRRRPSMMSSMSLPFAFSSFPFSSSPVPPPDPTPNEYFGEPTFEARGEFGGAPLRCIAEDRITPPLQRCCVELSKPVEKILVRYERLPKDIFSPPLSSECTTRTRNVITWGSLKPVASLWRFLYHRRWIWAAQSSTGSPLPPNHITQILATVTEMRLEEGFHFAFFSAGTFTMVREVQMKVTSTGDLCMAHSGDLETMPCTVQYVVFPPQRSSVTRREKNLDEQTGDDDDDESTEFDANESDGFLHLVTECWIEPQHGIVADPHPYHFSKLAYDKIPQEVYKQDLECVSTLITTAHLSLMCQNSAIPSPSGSSPPYDFSTRISGRPEIQYVPFCFDITRLLPKCQQVEMLFSTLIQDLSAKLDPTNSENSSNSIPEEAINEQFFACIFDDLREITDREVTMGSVDWEKFPLLVRLRDRPWENSEVPFECPYTSKEEDLPKWRCFVKGVSPTHSLLIILPASYDDLLKLIIREKKTRSSDGTETNSMQFPSKSIRLVVEGVDDAPDALLGCTGATGRAGVGLLSSDVESGMIGRSMSLGNAPPPSVSVGRARAKSGSGILARNLQKQSDLSDWAKKILSKKAECSHLSLSKSVLNRSFEGSTGDSIRSSLEAVFIPDNGLLPESRKFWAAGSDGNGIPSIPSRTSVFDSVESDSVGSTSNLPSSVKGSQKQHRPLYGSVVLPIYVYDCPLSGMISSLVCRHEARAREKDEFFDHTYKFNSELPEMNVSVTGGSSGSNAKFDRKAPPTPSTPDEKHRRGITRSGMCESIELCVMKSFITSVFKCLQQKLTVHAQDVLAAVERCQDIPIELDLTDFLELICHHVKTMRMKTGRSRWGSNEAEAEFSLNSLRADQPCECVQNLHHCIKLRFFDALQRCFQIVPSHPQYFFYCPPGWGKRTDGTNTEMNFDECAGQTDSGKSFNTSDSIVFKHESSEFNLGAVGTSDHETRGRQNESLYHDDHRTSVQSNVDSMSEFSVDSNYENIGDLVETRCDAPPLFLQLMCAIRQGTEVSHFPVSSVPICLAELLPWLEHFGESMDMTKTQIQLNVLCLTLPPIILSTLTKRGREGLRSTSFCSGASSECIDPSEALHGEDDSDNSVIDDDGRFDNALDLLPAFQKMSVYDTVDEMKWLLMDEMVSSMLENENLDSSLLAMVCDHVRHSNGRASCIYREVPLEFVCYPDASYEKFVEKLKDFKVNQYKLRQVEGYYYVSESDCSISRRNRLSLAKRISSVSDNEFSVVDASNSEVFDEAGPRFLQNRFRSITHDAGEMQVFSQEFQVHVKKKEANSWNVGQSSQNAERSLHQESDGFVGSADRINTVEDIHRIHLSSTSSEDDRIRLPGFWLILCVDRDKVKTYFHCRSGSGDIHLVDRWRKVYYEVIAKIKSTCKIVNQILLLQDLHDSRSCRQLLEPEAPEDVWPKDDATSTLAILDPASPRMYPKDRSPDDTDMEKPFLEASLRLKPGEFSCGAVLIVQFYLHPRLKAPGVKTGAHRAVTVLQGVLSAFSVVNRKNMFVYQDCDGNVFYLRLHESPPKRDLFGPLGICERSDEPVAASGRFRSYSYGSTFPSRTADHDASYEILAEQSSAENESPISNSLSQRNCDDFLFLVVHGVSEASPSITVGLVEMLRKRLDEAVLDIITIMLLRNSQCKLRPEDVHFIQRPHEKPVDEFKLRLPIWSVPYLPAVYLYLKQNLMQFLYPPRYIDNKSEHHFVDGWEDVQDDPHATPSEQHEGDILLYLLGNKPGAGADGIACISMVIADGAGIRVVWNSTQYPRGRLVIGPLALSPLQSNRRTPWTESDFHAVVQVKEVPVTEKFRKTPGSDSSEPDAEDREVEAFFSRGMSATVSFKVWSQGKIDTSQLRGKLRLAVQQSLWDLYSEYKVFLPMSEEDGSCKMESSSEPTTPLIFPRRSSVGGLSVSHPPDRTPSPGQQQGARSPLKSQLSLAEPPAKTRVNDYYSRRSPQAETAQRPSFEVLENVFLPWLDFGFDDLNVPSVRRTAVVLSSRQNVDSFLREFCGIVEGMDDELSVFVVDAPKSTRLESERRLRRKVERVGSHTQTPSCVSRNGSNESPCSVDYQTFVPVSDQESIKGDRECLSRFKYMLRPSSQPEYFLFARRLGYWKFSQFSIPETERSHSSAKGPVRFHSGAPVVGPSPSITPTLPGQSTFQPVSILAVSSLVGSSSSIFASPDPSKFVVTRQNLIYVTVKDKDVIIFTYNWSRDANEQLMVQTNRLTAWLNSRTRLLHSIVYQKLGLFNGQPIVNVDRKDKDSRYFQDVDALIKCQRFPSRDGTTAAEQSRHNSGSSHHEDLRSHRPPPGPPPILDPLAPPAITLPIFLEVYRDTQPRLPLHMTNYGISRDIVGRHGRQMQEIRKAEFSETERKARIQNLAMEAQANVPVNMNHIQDVCTSVARPMHFIYTPLLFLPRWRSILASIRDHSAFVAFGVGNEVDASHPTQTPPATSTSNPFVGGGSVVPPEPPPITRSRHNSGQTITSGEPRLSSAFSRGARNCWGPAPTEDESWHLTLLETYMREYIQYLVSLGFMSIQTRITTGPGKGRRMDGKSMVAETPPPLLIVSGSSRLPMGNVFGAGGGFGRILPQFLMKPTVGGLIVVEVGISEPYAYTKLFGLEGPRLIPKNSTTPRQHILNFIAECDSIMFVLHMHSFSYDYHLRTLHAYLSARNLLFRHGYHLTSFLDDFIKYYTKGPNYARNLIHSGTMVIENTYTPGVELYNYLMNHCEKIYEMRVMRVSPCNTSTASSAGAESEYVLIKLSTHVATYKDANEVQQRGEFDVTVVIALDNESWDGRVTSENFIALKFYVMLTNKRDVYPKQVPSRFGKFRTVSTPTTPTTPTHPKPVSLASSISSNGIRDHDEIGSDRSVGPATPTVLTPNPTQLSGFVSWSASKPSVRRRTQKGFMGIKVESVFYTGFFSSYEEAMQQILAEQVSQAKSKIREVVEKAVIHCRRDALWERLEAKPCTMSFSEFSELLSLVVVRSLRDLDPNLAPLFHMSAGWFTGLAKFMISRYPEEHRTFSPHDGTQMMQYVLTWNSPSPKSCFAFLFIDHSTPRVELGIAYKEPIIEELFKLEHPPERVSTIMAHTEAFVDLCCFHLWSNIVLKV